MTGWLDALIQGVLLGGLYALFAAGLSLIFGVMRLVNLAHGDFIVRRRLCHSRRSPARLGSSSLWPRDRVPVLFVIGFALQHRCCSIASRRRTSCRRCWSPSVFRSSSERAGLQLFSADSAAPADQGAIETASIPLGGGFAVGVVPATLTLVSAIVVIMSSISLFYGTAIGQAFLAQCPMIRTIAQLMGIDVNTASLRSPRGWRFAVIAVAALFLGRRANFDPTIGRARLLYAFEAVIIGGLGSLWGALAGGIVLGLAQTIGAALSPEWQILSGHIAFLAVLVSSRAACFRARWTKGRAMDSGTLKQAFYIETADTASRVSAVILSVALIAAVLLPVFANRDLIQNLIFLFYMMALAQCFRSARQVMPG